MLKNILTRIIACNKNLTVRIRLVILTVTGLAIAMALWGIIQLTALDRLLAMIGHVVERIGAGAFPANETAFCRYCDFRRECREKGPA